MPFWWVLDMNPGYESWICPCVPLLWWFANYWALTRNPHPFIHLGQCIWIHCVLANKIMHGYCHHCTANVNPHFCVYWVLQQKNTKSVSFEVQIERIIPLLKYEVQQSMQVLRKDKRHYAMWILPDLSFFKSKFRGPFRPVVACWNANR